MNDKRVYVSPMCAEKGDIASLTQEFKTFGSNDGVLFSITGNPGDATPIGPAYS